MKQFLRKVRLPIQLLAFAAPAFAQLTITTSSPLPNIMVSRPYQVQFNATGGTGTVAWSKVTPPTILPAGVDLTTGGLLNGTPLSTAGGPFTLRVQATAGTSTTKDFSLTVLENLAITSPVGPALPSGSQNSSYNATVIASGGQAPRVFNASGLPSGLSINSSTGAITGTPTVAGTFTGINVTVADSSPSPFIASLTYSLTISPNSQPIITTTSPLVNAIVGQLYSQTMTATGGATPYVWTVNDGSTLPSWLGLTGSTGTLQGMPSAANIGTTSFFLRVTDNVGQFSIKQLFLTVAAASGSITINTTSLPNAVIGTNYSNTLLVSGGTAPYSWSLAPGFSLPSWLNLSSAGVLSGTPTVGSNGTLSFTVQVNDSSSTSNTKGLSLQVNPAMTITTSSPLPVATSGQSYSQTLVAAGGTGVGYSWALASGSSLPGWLNLSAAGILSGTPPSGTTVNFTAQVTDTGNNATLTKTFALTVNGAAGTLSITSSTLPTAIAGQAYSFTFQGTGGSGTGFSWTVASGSSQPPANLILSSGGALTGIPAVGSVGTATFTIQLNDSASNVTTKQFTLTVNPSISITTSSPLPSALVNQPYNQGLTATGGTGTGYTWILQAGSSLPTGLTLSTAGVISGTPTVLGTSPAFNVQVTDSGGNPASKSFQISVTNSNLTISTVALPNWTAGVVYNQVLSATGANGAITWSLQGGTSLPAGLNLATTTGVISGNPTTPNVAPVNFTIGASDASSNSTTKAFSITINALPTITTTSLNGGLISSSYSQQLTSSGGTAPLAWSVVQGSLPAGVTLNASTGLIAGTPSASGNFPVTIQVTDNVGATGSKLFSLAIASSALTITTNSLPTAALNSAYTATLAAAGGSGTGFSWVVTQGLLPSGLFLASNGTISGIPTSAGTSNFTVQVTDSANNVTTKLLSITVSSSSLTITSPSILPQGTVNAIYATILTGSGGSGSGYLWSLVQGALPTGLALSNGGAISGTPTVAGTSNFTVQLVDSINSVTTKQLSITVVASTLTITSNSPLPDANQGQPYVFTVQGAGGGGGLFVFTLESGALPSGMNLASNGVLSGTPSASGTFNFTIRLQDGAGGSVSKPFSLAVIAPSLTITTSSLPAVATGTAFTTSLSANGGVPPYNWTILTGSLPSGLQLNSTTGVISGTTNVGAGNYPFRVQVRDLNNLTAFADLTLQVVTFAITTTSLPDATLGAPYVATLSAIGGAPPYFWTVAIGALPAGLQLNQNTGQITGTPNQSGQSTFTIQARESGNNTVNKQLTINVTNGVSIITSTLPNASVGLLYDQTLQAAGGTQPYTWSVIEGSLPVGITLNGATGNLRGTPINTSITSFNFTIRVADNSGLFTTKPFNITLVSGSSLAISTPGVLPNANPGALYSQTLVATGGVSPYTWSLLNGLLPNGYSLSSQGVIAGNTTLNGTFQFTIQVTDSANQTASRLFTLNVGTSTSLSITTAGLPVAAIGVPYAQALSATGGTGTGYVWTVVPSSGQVPPGLTLTTAGALTGTPNTAGTFNFTVQVTDSANSSATRNLSIIVNPTSNTPAITTTTVPSGAIGTPYSVTALSATGGSGTGYTWSLVSGQLPQGVTLSTGGILSGTPSVSGTFNFTIRVTDSQNNTGTKDFSIIIASSNILTIQTSTLPNGAIGIPYSQQLTATGGTGAGYVWTIVGQGPPGITVTTGGILTGTPTTAGTFNFTVQVADSSNTIAARQLQLIVGTSSGLTIVTNTIPNAVLNSSYNFGVQATGGTQPYSWSLSAGTLPQGLNLNPSSGLITGTPTAPGAFQFTVRVQDSANPANGATKTFSINVGQGLAITTSALPSPAIGSAYNFTLVVAGGTAPFFWSVTSGQLPDGINLGNTTGLLSGIPTVAGPFQFTLQVTDTANSSATRQFSMQVNTALSITTTSLPGGSVGDGYNQTLAAAGGSGSGYTWAITTGQLPAGLTLNGTTGVISGTATANGTSTFTIQVTDSSTATATKQLSITIGTTLTIVTASLPNAATGTAYNQLLTAAGGTPPLQWTLSVGTLPTGLTLNPATGAITGTPTAAGNSSFTARVQDSVGTATTKQLSITVADGLTIQTDTDLPNAAENTAYSQQLTASGGNAPYTWIVSVGTLPAGLALSNSGLISGTPTSSGNYSFIIQLTDSQQQTIQKAFTLVISGKITIVSPSALPNATVRTPYSEVLVASGGATPYTWALAPGGTPPIGITISQEGIVSGTPTSAGAFSFTVQVTDRLGATTSRAFTLSVLLNLTVTTASPLTAATAGSSYAQPLAAAGGQPPYTWTITGGALPAGLTLSQSGIVSGSPTAVGTFTFTAQVTDNARNTASGTFSITTRLPATPSFTIGGISDAITPATQPALSINIGTPFPVAISGVLTMTFTPDAVVAGDDPAVVFTNGSRVLNFTIPANGSAQLPTGFAMQTGTVAGTISLTLRLQSGGTDITPQPAPVITGRIARAAPVTRSVVARRVAGGLEITVIGYSTSREITNGQFRFSPAPGSSLQTTDLTVQLGDGAQRWYQSDASRAFGSQFTLTQLFNVTGDTSSIASVTVTLNNSQGAAQPVTSNFQ